ncbi:transposase [Citrobacter freundii]|uniref:transposase n=1 Tax=Citrobacter freundii TaxID=546 RepID=UPI001A93FBC6|nr:transposase [Citrobacter freundii]MBO0958074.1 transposase [Citrobacter freundii]MCF0038249.1 transposase [Citrobacter freundii]
MVRDEHEKEVGHIQPAYERVNLNGGSHPLLKMQEDFANKLIQEKQEKESRLPSEIINVFPEVVEMPDVCKSEALLELEKKYYPVLKAQRIKLDDAYSKVTQMQAAIEPNEFEIMDEIEQKPYVYFDYNDNDGFGTFPEQIPDVINNLPEGSRVAKIVKASRGNGSFIYLTDKTQEELNEVAKQNILKARNKVIDTAKQELANQLKVMKQLIGDYEVQKKQALQADIEQLVKLSGKYAKVI